MIWAGGYLAMLRSMTPYRFGSWERRRARHMGACKAARRRVQDSEICGLVATRDVDWVSSVYCTVSGGRVGMQYPAAAFRILIG